MRNDRVCVGARRLVLGERAGPVRRQRFLPATGLALKPSVELQEMTRHAMTFIANRTHVRTLTIYLMTIFAGQVSGLSLGPEKPWLEMNPMIKPRSSLIIHAERIVEATTNLSLAVFENDGKFRMVRGEVGDSPAFLQDDLRPAGRRFQIGVARETTIVARSRKNGLPSVLWVTLSTTWGEQLARMVASGAMTGDTGSVAHVPPEPPPPINRVQQRSFRSNRIPFQGRLFDPRGAILVPRPPMTQNAIAREEPMRRGEGSIHVNIFPVKDSDQHDRHQRPSSHPIGENPAPPSKGMIPSEILSVNPSDDGFLRSLPRHQVSLVPQTHNSMHGRQYEESHRERYVNVQPPVKPDVKPLLEPQLSPLLAQIEQVVHHRMQGRRQYGLET